MYFILLKTGINQGNRNGQFDLCIKDFLGRKKYIIYKLWISKGNTHLKINEASTAIILVILNPCFFTH